MKKKYRVRWASIAERDLGTIVESIVADSPTNALRTLEKMKKAAGNLCTFPERGRIVPELRDQGVHIYRELVVVPWRIIYRISGSTVYVLSVIDARRNVEDILLDRLIDS